MIRRLLASVALVAATSVPAIAQPTYSDVFFFGTSELDTGNWLFNPTLSGNALAPTAARGFYDGRWQSGPAFSDYFAALLGHDAVASLEGGQNYAYGFGWLGPLAGEPAPGAGSLGANTALYFGTQVSSALTSYGSVLPSDALYVVSIGSNDFDVFGRTLDKADDIANVAVAGIQRLVDAGARSFVIRTLGGTDPYILLYNETLLNGLAAIEDIDVTVVDTRTFNQSVLLAPGFLASLGITDFGSCLADPVCEAAAIARTTAGEPYLDSKYFTFDGVHRDPKISEVLAQYALARLPATTTVPEPGTVVLVAVGLAGLGVLRRRRR